MKRLLKRLPSSFGASQIPAFDTRNFWIMRAKKHHRIFKVKRFLLLRQRQFAEGRSNQKTLASTYKKAWIWPAFSALLVAIVAVLENWIPALPDFPSDREGAYMNLTMGISAVGGLLIGLYYSALITAAGTVYASVPTPLRMRLVRERTGATYMWFVAMVTSIALSAALFHIVFDLQSRAITVILLLGGSLSVFAFVILGRQAFALFNPSNLLRPAYQNLVSIVKEHVEQGTLYTDKAFQENARLRAYRELDVIETVRDLALNSPAVRSRDLRQVVQNASWVLQEYHSLKPSITLQSQWYERLYEHTSWRKRSGSTSDISIRTATPLQPKEVVNYHWLENRLLKLSGRYLELDPSDIDLGLATTAVSSLSQMVSSITKAHDTDFALNVVTDLVERVSGIVTAKQPSRSLNTEHRTLLQLISVTDRLIIQLLLDSSQTLGTYTESMLEDHATSIGAGKAFSSTWNLPLDTARRLSTLFSSISVERMAERQTISANWYISERIRLELLRSLKAGYDRLFPDLLSHYENLYCAATDPWSKAILLSGQAEFHYKAGFHFEQMKSVFDALTREKVITDLMWPSLNFGTSGAILREAKRTHSVRLGELAVTIAAHPEPKHLPDFGGQFLALLQEEVFNATLEQDLDLLEKTLPNYAAAVLFAVREGYDSDLPLTDPRAPSLALQAFAELMDMVEIFGLAKVVAEFHGNSQLWKVFETHWQKIISITDENFLSRIASLNSLANGGMQMEAHYDIRFRWRRSVEVLLESAPVEREFRTAGGGSFPIERNMPTHASYLVRALTPTGMRGLNNVNGIAVMMTVYIRSALPDGSGEPAYNERNLTDRIERFGQ